MADLQTFYNAKNVISVWNELKHGSGSNNFNKPLEKWFPYKKTLAMSIDLVSGYRNQNVSMDLCAYDTNARIRGLSQITSETRDIPYFKNSVLFTEKDRRKILEVLATHQDPTIIATAFEGHMHNVVDVLLNAPDVVAERYRAQLLQHGTIAMSSPDSAISKLSIGINYDPTDEWADKNVMYWSANPSDGTTDIVADLIEVLFTFSQTNGMVPCTMIMNHSTYIAIGRDPALRHMLDTQKWDTLEQVLSFKSGVPVSIMVNTATYKSDFGEPDTAYWEQDVISIVPNSPLGGIMCGLTPVQYDQIYSNAKRDVASSAENFSILCKYIDDPVQIETIGSACLLPKFDGMHKVFVIRPQ